MSSNSLICFTDINGEIPIDYNWSRIEWLHVENAGVLEKVKWAISVAGDM